jgi:hypothetical protein
LRFLPISHSFYTHFSLERESPLDALLAVISRYQALPLPPGPSPPTPLPQYFKEQDACLSATALATADAPQQSYIYHHFMGIQIKTSIFFPAPKRYSCHASNFLKTVFRAAAQRCPGQFPRTVKSFAKTKNVLHQGRTFALASGRGA